MPKTDYIKIAAFTNEDGEYIEAEFYGQYAVHRTPYYDFKTGLRIPVDEAEKLWTVTHILSGGGIRKRLPNVTTARRVAKALRKTIDLDDAYRNRKHEEDAICKQVTDIVQGAI